MVYVFQFINYHIRTFSVKRYAWDARGLEPRKKSRTVFSHSHFKKKNVQFQKNILVLSLMPWNHTVFTLFAESTKPSQIIFGWIQDAFKDNDISGPLGSRRELQQFHYTVFGKRIAIWCIKHPLSTGNIDVLYQNYKIICRKLRNNGKSC